ncbi:MAG: hypothetical protein ACI8Z5_002707 [Lentimonas sp.]|jgi:hypothetical protein
MFASSKWKLQLKDSDRLHRAKPMSFLNKYLISKRKVGHPLDGGYASFQRIVPWTVNQDRRVSGPWVGERLDD